MLHIVSRACRGLAAVLASVVLAACATAHTSRIETAPDGTVFERIYNDYGGFVNEQQIAWRDRINAHDIRYFVVDGTCASYCAFVALYAPRSCYTRNVTFHVHPAAMFGMVETTATMVYTEHAVSHWPPGLREWWRQNRPDWGGVTLGYDDLIGIIPEKACPPDMLDGHARARVFAHEVGESLAVKRPPERHQK